MPDHSAKEPTSSAGAPTLSPAYSGGGAGGWPDGWYVYDNGRVDGPFTADETFKMDLETASGKPRLVSRKGFSQWYALKDLSEIFRMTDQMGRRATAEMLQSEAQLKGHGAKAETPAPGPSQTKVAKPPKKPPSMATPVAEAPIAEAPVAEAPAPEVREPAVDASPTAVATRKAKPLPRKALSKAELMQGYFLARGRLRLGKLRNPWVTAFVGLPLSLGVYWPVWYSEVAREAVHHSRNSNRSPLPPGVLAMVPILHFFMIFKLAKLVSEMESQNRYRSVSPVIAAVFAIFPPFALAYLQDAVNRHWLLHTKHTLVKKRSDS